MRKLLLVGVAMMVSTIQPGTTIAQDDPSPTADAATTITLKARDTCTIDDDHLDCGGPGCGYDKKVWWTVVNKMQEDARVAVLDFKIGDFYVDPLIGPGNKRDHSVAVPKVDDQILKTRVGRLDNKAFMGTYEYKIAVSLDGGKTFTICLDPMIDIID